MSDLPRQDTDDSADTGPHHESRSAPLDRYFALSDTAGHCKADFAELIALFTPDARLEPAGGPVIQGTTALREFFLDFFAAFVYLLQLKPRHCYAVLEGWRCFMIKRQRYEEVRRENIAKTVRPLPTSLMKPYSLLVQYYFRGRRRYSDLSQ